MIRWWWASAFALLVACGTDAPDVPHLDWPTSAAIPLTQAGDDYYYTAMVAIGDQTFALLVDTGSSTTVVASTQCTSCTTVSPLYAPGATAKDTGNQTSGMYVDFSTWDGEIYVDQVGLGNTTPAVPLEIAAMVDELAFFRDDYSEGIFGAGPTQALEGDTTAYQTTATESGAPNELAFELCDGSGTMWIGDPDASAMGSALMYTPLTGATDDAPYYNVAISDLGIGGTSLGFGPSTYKAGAIDTGTTDFVIPTDAYDMLIAQVDSSPGVAALFGTQSLANGCFTAAGVTAAQVDAMLPAMSTTFTGSATFVVSSPPTRSYLNDVGNGMFCLAAADGGAGDQSVTILGDAFMRGFVTVLDFDHDRAGFAPDVGCGN
ncbi:MAG TPA: pepsin-like aspartic protease [Kofleriaceae bacterium]|jgi:hypothetical protein|nr:pepsin-like aspartic protease [Kofleriaceae bacterium]